jgi:hypothetical protein
MYTRVGLVSGGIVISDDFPEKEMEDWLSENDGLVGTGDFENVRCENIEDAIAFANNVLQIALTDRETGSITVLVNGEDIKYPSTEVAWFRIVR